MIESARITVTDTPTLISQPEPGCGGHTVVVSNLGTTSVYLDGANATPDNSFELQKKQMISVPMGPDGLLYAVTAAGETGTICTLVTHR